MGGGDKRWDKCAMVHCNLKQPLNFSCEIQESNAGHQVS